MDRRPSLRAVKGGSHKQTVKTCQFTVMKIQLLINQPALALMLALIPALTQAAARDDAGAVFTMDNATTANHVLAYNRSADGALTPAGVFDTGGRGTGAGLGNQSALVLSRDGQWLFACNAGSDEISVLGVRPNGLLLAQKISSEGKRPISLALNGNLLYVLNAGGQAADKDHVTGFMFFNGQLFHLPGSTRPLSADNTGPAQVSFSSDGRVLVVTEKNTRVIDTFTVDTRGLIDQHQQFQSIGTTPFGFAGHADNLFVSEASLATVSSYDLHDDGNLEVVSPSVPTTQAATCWVVVTRDGRFAYASNTGTGVISGYSVAPDASITLLNPTGVSGNIGTGSKPIDMALTANSRFLYVLNSGNNTLSVFRVNQDGSLDSLTGVSGIPSGANGLAAR